MITGKTFEKMLKAKQLAYKLRLLITEIDLEVSKVYDVDTMRDDDACGYVDMIDYGVGSFNINEANKDYIKREKK